MLIRGAAACSSQPTYVHHAPSAESPITRVDVRCAGIEPPALTEQHDPSYPPEVRKARVQGRVIMEGIVGTDGTVADITVHSSPSDALSTLAVHALGQWRYTQARGPSRVMNADFRNPGGS